MGEHRRNVDGRRVFSTEFKRTTVQWILSGEKTLAELSRQPDISPIAIRPLEPVAEAGATTAVQASYTATVTVLYGPEVGLVPTTTPASPFSV